MNARALAALLVAAGTASPAAAAPERPRQPGIYRVVPVANDPSFVIATPKHRILYMNRFGGSYYPGMPDNSSLNISSIPQLASSIPPFAHGDAAWAELMACVRDQYARFNIEVTDVDPGDVAHIESVVGGDDSDVQINGAAGVAPGAPCQLGEVSVVERAVVYTFDVGPDMQVTCEIVAQESGHALGMDHELLCEDPMTYLWGCGAKTFQDFAAPCGEFDPRGCRCGGTTQNSVEHLYAVLGAPDPVGPSVIVTEPADGAAVAPLFTISAEAEDDVEVTRVELWIDGVFTATDPYLPYAFTAPGNVSPGEHVVEVRAVDFGGNRALAAVTVTLEPGCTTSADCADDEDCAGMLCLPALSSPCTRHADCASGVCARGDDGTLVCTSACPCPDGFACGTGELCWVQAGGSGGCATSSRGHGGALALALSFVLVVAVLGAAATARGSRSRGSR